MRILRSCPGTRAFFSWGTVRRAAERIEKIRKVDAWSDTTQDTSESGMTNVPTEMAGEVAKFYEHLYREPAAKDEIEERNRTNAREKIRDVLKKGRTLSKEESEKCEGAITRKELDAVLPILPKGKSPGPDLLPNEFYSIFASEIGEPLLEALNEAHSTGEMPESMKKGNVAILYKKKDRTDIRKYRPITLLNNDYKLLTRILTVRMNKVIALVISPEQTGFVPGRFIVENTHLMKLLQEYCEGKDQGGMLVGIDFEKAFDSVAWSAIRDSMRDLGFGEDLIKWISMIYDERNPASRRVRVNGEYSTWFNLGRGVAQGCPISPILFLCVAEALTRLVNTNRTYEGVKVGANPVQFRISQFADDTIMIIRNSTSLPRIWEILHTFYLGTGLKVNKSKTEGILMGDCRRARESAPEDIKWAADGEYIISLGAPLGFQFDKHAFYMTKYRKMRARMAQWSGRIFMKAETERVQLANALLLSLFWYWIQSIEPTNTLAHLINSDIDQFIWGNNPMYSSKENAGDAGDGKWRAWISKGAAILPKNSGGIGKLDWEAQVAAMQAMWIARYMDGRRGRWKEVLDYYIQQASSHGRGVFMTTVKTQVIVGKLPEGLSFWKRAIREFAKIEWSRPAGLHDAPAARAEPIRRPRHDRPAPQAPTGAMAREKPVRARARHGVRKGRHMLHHRRYPRIHYGGTRGEMGAHHEGRGEGSHI